MQNLPISLQSEISISVNKKIIPKVNIFNTGTPGFIPELLRQGKPMITLKDHTIIYKGDAAEEIFLLVQGHAEVLTSNDKITAAILSEGAYFGEIGILLDMKRTVTIRAMTDCICKAISKDKIYKILEKYPD